jgi:hypothetical protein
MDQRDIERWRLLLELQRLAGDNGHAFGVTRDGVGFSVTSKTIRFSDDGPNVWIQGDGTPSEHKPKQLGFGHFDQIARGLKP